jgi:hypothetical protein
METKQPIWKCIGHIGDLDPISYGGGFVYTDETGVYGPELTYFIPSDDSIWESVYDSDSIPVEVYRILLESGPKEWFYSKLDKIASYVGIELADVLADANSKDPMILANLFSDLICYFGPHEFDSYPVTMTEGEARKTYATELKQARR